MGFVPKIDQKISVTVPASCEFGETDRLKLLSRSLGTPPKVQANVESPMNTVGEK